MIIVFHSLYFLVRYLRKIYQVSKNVLDLKKCHLVGSEVTFQSNCTVDDAFNVSFDPPLFKQRYAIVQQILLNEHYRPNIKKIAEFGCSELSFFVYLKNLFGVNEILCVDIDKDVLVDNQYKVQPLTVDYLKRRSEKLNVQLFCGSVADPDNRLLGANAVVAIELIEHLYPDTLDALPYNVFGFVQPLIVIFTTPNVEFNVVFNLDGFRHHDHKFEWTRSQFEDWCRNITLRFPKYYVVFDGVGPGPEGTSHLGKCTQIAVFIKEDRKIIEKPMLEPLSEVPRSCRIVEALQPIFEEEMKESHGICTYYSHSLQVRQFNGIVETNTPGLYYEQIDVIDYPYTVDNRTPERRILDEVLYKIYSCATQYSELYNLEKSRVEYPLHLLVSNEDGYFTTPGEIKTLLERENFTVEECRRPGDEEKTLCVVYDLMMENKSSSPGSDENLSDDLPIKVPWTLACVEETDWDTEFNSPKVNVEHIDSLETDDPENIEPLPSDNCDPVVVSQQYSFQNENSENNESNENEAMSASTSNNRESSKSKKGYDVKNRSNRSSSQEKEDSNRKSSESKRSSTDTRRVKKTIDLKVKESSHSSAQGSSSNKSSRSNKPSSSKSKIPTKPAKKLSSKIEDSVASTSASKKKRKPKKGEEDRDDIKTLTECIVYNTLNNINDTEIVSETSNEITTNDCKDSGITELTEDILSLDFPQEVEIIHHTAATEVVVEFLENVLDSFEFTNADLKRELQEAEEQSSAQPVHAISGTAEVVMTALNMASREALFDSNSEIDMLEEFEIPTAPVNTNTMDNQTPPAHPNVILIGLNLNNDEEGVDNADPFPNWLLQLLGANVEEGGESHDEPHFYCQGDGIGVHPSIIEVEIDEDESTSESSSSNDVAVAEHTISESAVATLSNDESSDAQEIAASAGVVLSVEASAADASTLGTHSASESDGEFYDTVEEVTVHSDVSKE